MLLVLKFKLLALQGVSGEGHPNVLVIDVVHVSQVLKHSGSKNLEVDSHWHVSILHDLSLS